MLLPPPTSGIHSAKLYINTLNPAEISTACPIVRWLEPESQSELHYSVWYYFRDVHSKRQSTVVERLPMEIETRRASDLFFALNVGNRSGRAITSTCTTKITKPPTSRRSKTFRMANGSAWKLLPKCAGDNTGPSPSAGGAQIFECQMFRRAMRTGTASGV